MPPARFSRLISTCATPVFTRAISLGADVVMHSATKYLNGHSDVIAGALSFARDDALCARARTIRQSHGMILHPFEAFLLIRGLRTLDLRVRAAAANAMELANRLSNHAAVSAVLYPGLPHHPGHDIARRQMNGGFGGHAVDPRSRRRQGRDRNRGPGAPLETGDLSRRSRVAHRTPRLDRGGELPMPA